MGIVRIIFESLQGTAETSKWSKQVELMSRYRTRLTLVSVLLTSSAEPKENYVTTTELEKSLEQVPSVRSVCACTESLELSAPSKFFASLTWMKMRSACSSTRSTSSKKLITQTASRCTSSSRMRSATIL